MSIVSLELAGRTPRVPTRAMRLGLPGIRSDPRLGRDGGQRDRHWRRRLRAPAPRAAQPAGQLPRQSDARSAGAGAVDGAAGLLRAACDDRPAVQRVSAALRRDTRGDGGGARRGAQERRAHPVVVLVRASRSPQRSTSPRRCSTIRSAATTATSRSTASRRSSHLGRTGQGPAATSRCTCPGTPAAIRPPGSDCHCTGRSTTSWPPVLRPRGGCGSSAGVGPADVDLPQVYDGFSPFVCFWLEVLGFCPDGRGPPSSCRTAASTATPRRAAGAVGRWRARQRPDARHPADARVLPPALRPGRRPPARTATVGVACHSSPHFGGAVVYSSDPV